MIINIDSQMGLVRQSGDLGAGRITGAQLFGDQIREGGSVGLSRTDRRLSGKLENRRKLAVHRNHLARRIEVNHQLTAKNWQTGVALIEADMSVALLGIGLDPQQMQILNGGAQPEEAAVLIEETTGNRDRVADLSGGRLVGQTIRWVGGAKEGRDATASIPAHGEGGKTTSLERGERLGRRYVAEQRRTGRQRRIGVGFCNRHLWQV